MTSSYPSLLFIFLSVPKHLNPNPIISPPHTRRRPLLLRIRLDAVPTASTLAPHSSSTCASTVSPLSTSMPPVCPPSRFTQRASLLLHVHLHHVPAVWSPLLRSMPPARLPSRFMPHASLPPRAPPLPSRSSPNAIKVLPQCRRGPPPQRFFWLLGNTCGGP
jgi:hypothetical protein